MADERELVDEGTVTPGGGDGVDISGAKDDAADMKRVLAALDLGKEKDEREGIADDEREGYNPDDTPEQRLSRRARRNRSHRVAQDAAQQQINDLQGHVARLAGFIESMGFRDLGNQIEQARGAAQQAGSHYRIAEEELAKAIEAGDAKTQVTAQRLRDEALRRVEHYGRMAQELEGRARTIIESRPPQGYAMPPQQPQPQQPQISERQKQFAEDFMDEFPWFDPQGQDRRSLLVRAEDQAVANEGYMPDTEAFWNRLTERVRGLNLGPSSGGRNVREDENDEGGGPASRNEGGMVPTSRGRSVSRPSGRANFTLDADQIDALRQRDLIPEPGETLSPEKQKELNTIVAFWRSNKGAYDEAKRRGANGRAT